MLVLLGIGYCVGGGWKDGGVWWGRLYVVTVCYVLRDLVRCVGWLCRVLIARGLLFTTTLATRAGVARGDVIEISIESLLFCIH